jgi:hypothetical protein
MGDAGLPLELIGESVGAIDAESLHKRIADDERPPFFRLAITFAIDGSIAVALVDDVESGHGVASLGVGNVPGAEMRIHIGEERPGSFGPAIRRDAGRDPVGFHQDRRTDLEENQGQRKAESQAKECLQAPPPVQFHPDPLLPPRCPLERRRVARLRSA